MVDTGLLCDYCYFWLFCTDFAEKEQQFRTSQTKTCSGVLVALGEYSSSFPTAISKGTTELVERRFWIWLEAEIVCVFKIFSNCVLI